MTNRPSQSISDALEQLALALGENGAVPVAELVRALERAAERLRTRAAPDEIPVDLVTQAEASRLMGVSRQAVNQWVRKGTLRTYVSRDGHRHAPQVSLSEVAVTAHRRAPARWFPGHARQLEEFLERITAGSAGGVAAMVRESLQEGWSSGQSADESRVLREFVVAAMGTGDSQQEFSASGVRLLEELNPTFAVDRDSDFGRLAGSLDLLVTSAHGQAGFDSPTTAVLGLLGVATVGAQYEGADADAGREVARAAGAVWGEEWPDRLYDAASHVGALRPSPLTRYTASLTYLDHNRFLRQAQTAGVSVGYSRGPGPILPQRFYGGPLLHDILHGGVCGPPVWRFSPKAAAHYGRPADNPSTVNPFRIFNYEYGLLDRSIHGIRRYCFSAADARTELRATLERLTAPQRETYLRRAVETLARTLALPHVELAAIDTKAEFDWWKDHIIRSSQREILIGLRDENARRTAHALLVQTSMLTDVVGAADADNSLRDRLRIYVKNLEFDVVDARYKDDLRRGVTRIVKGGGIALSAEESLALARSEIETYVR